MGGFPTTAYHRPVAHLHKIECFQGAFNARNGDGGNGRRVAGRQMAAADALRLTRH